MDEAKKPDEGEAELKRPEAAVDDLEPDTHEGDSVKGGGTYQKIKLDDDG